MPAVNNAYIRSEIPLVSALRIVFSTCGMKLRW